MHIFYRAMLCAVACAPNIATAQDTESEPSDDKEILVLGTRERGYRATVAPQTNK